MDRHIAYFQIPSFGIALARTEDTSLRNRPVAIALSCPSRTCLQEVSDEACGDGLYPGMSVASARRLCPSLRILAPDPIRLRTAHRQLQHLIGRFSPVWEPVHPGALYLDLTGTARLFGPPVDTAVQIEREVNNRHGLAGIIGIAGNKLVSHLAAATLEQPPHIRDIHPGSEPGFLAPLPATLLPGLTRACDSRIRTILEDLNLRTLGTIAEIPLPHLELAVGPVAALLHDWSLGIDHSPVLPRVEQPAIECSLSLEPDDIEDGRLLGHVYGLLEHVCRELRRQQRTCRRLVLTATQSDRYETSKHSWLPAATYWESDLFPVLQTLFFRCFERRVRLRSLAIRAECLSPPTEQLSLFDLQLSEEQVRGARQQRLSLVLDQARARFGDQTIAWGRTVVLKQRPKGRLPSETMKVRFPDAKHKN
ncbi:MAG: DNA polymerase Y family protein [Nitrospiraceae bacterium]